MEPIAVEVPVKVPTIPGPKLLPKAEPKPEAKVEPKAEAKVPAAPLPIAKPLFGVSRRQVVVVAAAACSLVAGIAAVRLIRPGKAELGDAPPAVVQPLAAATPTLAPVQASPAVPETAPSSGSSIPNAAPVRPVATANVVPSNTNSTAGTYLPIPAAPAATLERTEQPSPDAVAVAPSVIPLTPPAIAPSIAPVTPPAVAPSVIPLTPPAVAPSVIPLTPPAVAPSVIPLTPPALAPSIAPVTPPTLAPSIAPVTPPTLAPSVIPLTPPAVAPVTPTAGNDGFRATGTPAKVEPLPLPGAVSPVNVSPAGGLAIPPVGPNVVATGGQQPPTAPATPPLPLPNPALPKLPAVGPASPSSPEVPPLPGVAPTTPTLPATPPLNPVVTPKLPEVAPTVSPAVPPAIAPTIPVSGSPVVPPPSVNPTPNPAALPPAVVPNVPANPIPTTAPPKLEYVKPAGNPEVRPAANERPASTTFDVDLYEPRAGDTYDSISREFYNDVRYAAALRAFNGNRALQGGVQVEVPPMHILRKRFPQLNGATPASNPAPTVRPVGATPANGDWSPAGADPGFRASTNSTFVVPTGGMTVRGVAKQTLGSEQRWDEIWQLNRQITNPAEVLPAGTELKLPSGAKQP